MPQKGLLMYAWTSCRIWTDDDNLAFVGAYYPWFLKTYNALPYDIMRADSCRYLYMHQYGGVLEGTPHTMK
jgi:mannosyltransferase OCH1-like enzyme